MFQGVPSSSRTCLWFPFFQYLFKRFDLSNWVYWHVLLCRWYHIFCLRNSFIKRLEHTSLLEAEWFQSNIDKHYVHTHENYCRLVYQSAVISNNKTEWLKKLGNLGGFVAPHIWEIVGSKNFQRLPLFSMLYNDFRKFSENWDKEFKLGPTYFNFPGTGELHH